MSLTSAIFKGNSILEACLILDQAHVYFGARGEHVKKIQQALVILGAGIISSEELIGGIYGSTTARTVQSFKGPPRNIINTNYQNTPDAIVGRRTIAQLDREMSELENRPVPAPVVTSLYVSLTVDGEAHDHERCPLEFKSGVRVNHLATAINPQNQGRKVNIGGEGEASYLGFEDFVTDAFVVGGPPRPITEIIPDGSVSDICFRSVPISSRGRCEVARIAMPHCRLIYASNRIGLESSLASLHSLGTVIEHISLKDERQIDGLGFQIVVIDMNG